MQVVKIVGTMRNERTTMGTNSRVPKAKLVDALESGIANLSEKIISMNGSDNRQVILEQMKLHGSKQAFEAFRRAIDGDFTLINTF